MPLVEEVRMHKHDERVWVDIIVVMERRSVVWHLRGFIHPERMINKKNQKKKAYTKLIKIPNQKRLHV